MNRLLVASGLAFLAAFVLAVEQPVRAQFETPNRSFHDATAFRLEGRHVTVPCASCHLNGQYQGTPTTCFTCHWVRRNDDKYQTRLGTECEQCHRPVSWSAVRWDHAGATGVPLNPSHRTMACGSCHRDGNFSRGMVLCESCHRKDYDATKSPNHVAAGFPLNCESCHRPADATWRTGAGGDFNHNAIFPLQGVHATVSCVSCHRNNVFRGTARECVGCHQADYNAAQSPNHVAAGFSTSCETCHRATDPQWRGGTPFNHNAVFQLVGVHATQECAACHRNNVFRGTARTCVGCHQSEYNATRNPNHASAGFPTTCDSCHRASDSRWQGATFNHGSVFPLLGVHAAQSCATCHRNNVYRGTARTCVGCHQADYNATRDPNHATAGFPTACESCHRATDSSWSQGRFSHTWFPLTGPHNRPCAECHTTPNAFSQFSCTRCHARGETDSHHREVGGYRYDSVACYSCHPNGRH